MHTYDAAGSKRKDCKEETDMIRRTVIGHIRCSLLFAGLFTLWGCSAAHHAAIELDKVSRSIDRFGFASISTPFLSGPAREFQFDLDTSAKDYFEMAFTPEGGVRHLDARALDVQVAVRINIEQAIATLSKFLKVQGLTELELAKTEAGVQKMLLESLVETTPGLGDDATVKSVLGLLGVASEINPPELPEFTPDMEGLPELGVPFSEDDLLALKAVGSTFTPPKTLPDQAYRISAGEAILKSHGNVTTQAILTWFNHPYGNKLGNYELFFCPMIVSAQPGYQTRTGYLANITVNVDLARERVGYECTCKPAHRCGNHLEYLSDCFPDSSAPILVSGVFPLVDTQVLDLVNSRRRLYSLALQLSVMGFGSQGDFFADYAKKLEQDAQTQTALTAASAYTIGDTAFGFRVEPKFVASRDPTRLVTKPGRTLESRTFPAMAVILVDRKYLKRKCSACCAIKDCDAAKEPPCACNPQCKDPYDYLVFETSTRWTPISKWRRWIGGFPFGPSRYSEVESWARALALDKAEHWLDDGKPKRLFGGDIENKVDPFFGQVRSTHQMRQLEARTRILSKLALDSRALVRVNNTSAAAKVCVTDTYPKHGWRDQYTVITVRGQGFEGNVNAVTVGGVLCEFEVPNDCTLLVLVPPWHEANKSIPTKRAGFGMDVKTIAGLSKGEDLLGSANGPLTKLEKGTHELATGLPGSDEKWTCECDPQAKIVVPPPPLTPEEKKVLEGLNKRIVACSDECKEDKACKRNCELITDEKEKTNLLQELMKKDIKYQCWKACEDWKKEVRTKALEKKRSFGAGWAQIVISSRVPVLKGDKCDKPWQGDFDPSGDEKKCFDRGWMRFDKQLPKKPSGSPSKGGINISRDKAGRIIGVKTDSGGFDNAAKLLRIIKDSLNTSTDFSLELSAEGGVNVNSNAKTEK